MALAPPHHERVCISPHPAEAHPPRVQFEETFLSEKEYRARLNTLLDALNEAERKRSECERAEAEWEIEWAGEKRGEQRGKQQSNKQSKAAAAAAAAAIAAAVAMAPSRDPVAADLKYIGAGEGCDEALGVDGHCHWGWGLYRGGGGGGQG